MKNLSVKTVNESLVYISAPDEYCESTGCMGVWINPETEELEWNICYEKGKRYVFGYILRQKNHE